MQPLADKVITPDMVLPARAQADARTVMEIQPAALRLLAWHLQPFDAPQPLHPLVVDTPAFRLEQRGDAPVAITPILAGKPDDILTQRRFVRVVRPAMPLTGSMLPQN